MWKKVNSLLKSTKVHIYFYKVDGNKKNLGKFKLSIFLSFYLLCNFSSPLKLKKEKTNSTPLIL